MASKNAAKSHLYESTVLALKMTIPPIIVLVLITRFSLVNVISMSLWGLFSLVWTIKVSLDYAKRAQKTK